MANFRIINHNGVNGNELLSLKIPRGNTTKINSITVNEFLKLVKRPKTVDTLAGLVIKKANTVIGTQPNLNFIEGANVTLDIVNNTGTQSVDVTVNATGGSGGGQVDTVVAGTNVSVDDSDPENPIINVTIPPITFPLEEEGLGTAVYNPTMSGAEEIDLSSFSTYYGILTGTTTLSFINPPPNERTFVRSVKIKSTTTEGLIMPTTNWHYIGEFVPDGSLYDFQIECTIFQVIGEFYTCYINKLI